MKPFSVALFLLTVFLFSGCKKEEPAKIPSLSDAPAGFTESSATITCNITSDGGAYIIAYGVCWSMIVDPTIHDSKTVDGSGIARFVSTINGLVEGTTYYIRAYATNCVGTAYGNDIAFTTLGSVPGATTEPATNISGDLATLNAIVNANYLSTSVTFEYGTTISYGSTVSSSQNPVTGHDSTNVCADVSGLMSNTVYHFRIKAVNILGTVYGDDRTFKTLVAHSPGATTEPATNISGTMVTLNGIINASNLSTIVTFEYGTTISYDSTAKAFQNPVSGDSNINVSADIAGLMSNTDYHFRIKAVNKFGIVYGDDRTFTTLAGQAPSVVTLPATNISGTDATLNGVVNANDLPATVTFEYDTTTNYGLIVTATQSPVTGNEIINVSADISGLTVNANYHFRVKAENFNGTVYGDDIQFTTVECSQAPTAITLAATDFSGGKAILNGTVNAHGLPATVTFTINPILSLRQKHYRGVWGTVPAVPDTLTGDNITHVSVSVSPLVKGINYVFFVTATNSCRSVSGGTRSFIGQ
jgi:hypothetical protein